MTRSKRYSGDWAIAAERRSDRRSRLHLRRHYGWLLELAFDEQKTHQDPRRATQPAQVRSATPAGVIQEVDASSLGHFVIRSLMFDAAATVDLDRYTPLRNPEYRSQQLRTGIGGASQPFYRGSRGSSIAASGTERAAKAAIAPSPGPNFRRATHPASWTVSTPWVSTMKVAEEAATPEAPRRQDYQDREP